MDKVRKIEIKSQVRDHQLKLDAEALRRDRDQLRVEDKP